MQRADALAKKNTLSQPIKTSHNQKLGHGVWHFTLGLFCLELGWLPQAEGRKPVACSHPLDPKSTQSQEEEEEEEFA
jgi:hypothetical protein